MYSIGPVFRAENSNMPRHMTEVRPGQTRLRSDAADQLAMAVEIEDSYVEGRGTIKGLMLHIFRELGSRCREQIELVQTVYPSDDFLLPEPGKEVGSPSQRSRSC